VARFFHCVSFSPGFPSPGFPFWPSGWTRLYTEVRRVRPKCFRRTFFPVPRPSARSASRQNRHNHGDSGAFRRPRHCPMRRMREFRNPRFNPCRSVSSLDLSRRRSSPAAHPWSGRPAHVRGRWPWPVGTGAAPPPRDATPPVSRAGPASRANPWRARKGGISRHWAATATTARRIRAQDRGGRGHRRDPRRPLAWIAPYVRPFPEYGVEGPPPL
jgi:hypothetical protein